MSKLSCGGRGPCCHVGYSHRHCEHCDMVIATSTVYSWQYPIGINPWGQQWWSATGAGSTSGRMPPNPTVYAMNSGNTVAEHACEGGTS